MSQSAAKRDERILSASRCIDACPEAKALFLRLADDESNPSIYWDEDEEWACLIFDSGAWAITIDASGSKT